MAGLSAPGLGSGLDVNSLVTQLVAAERAPAQQAITRTGTAIDTKLSALGVMKGVLSGFQSSAGALRTESLLLARKAVSSDSTVLTATATTSAPLGTYSVEVLSLASTHKIASKAYVGGGDALVGRGRLTIEQNGASFQLQVASGTTLSQLRDAINGATDNTGVRAGIVTADGGARLVLTATGSGSAQKIKVTTQGAHDGLEDLEFDPISGSNPMSELSPARDAQVKVEGFTVSAAGNTVTGAIEGVTLNLLTAKPGTVLSVTVSQDIQNVKDRLSKMVADYNTVATTLGQLRSFDPATRKAGPLLGDSTLLGIEARLRRDISGTVDAVAGSPATLSAIGIGVGADGKLAINDAKLTTALQSDPAGVARLLAGDDGIAKRIYATLDGAIAAGGQVPARTDSLQTQKRGLQKQQDALELRMQALEASYRAQFGALDAMLSDMQSTGKFLAANLT